MAKVFIDIVGSNERQLDFKGQQFPSMETARQIAELISIDLAVSVDSRWIGAEVQLKDELGNFIYRCPVRQLDVHGA